MSTAGFGQSGVADAVQPAPAFTAFPSVNSFTIGAVTLPGKWTLTEAHRTFGWQIQKGYGLTGATVFPIGDDLVIAKFKGEFWSSTDFYIFRKTIRNLFFTKAAITAAGLVSGAIGIAHPELAALGVKAVVMHTMYAAIQEEKGLWVQHVDFLEYRPPLPAIKKPAFVIPPVAAPIPVALTNQQIEARDLANSATAKRALLTK